MDRSLTTAPASPLQDTPGVPEPEYFELLELAGRVEPTEDVRWDEAKGCWLTGSYAAYKEVAADPDLFQFPGRDPELAPPWLDREFHVWFEGGPKKFPFVEGEEHARLHRWWMHQFSPKQITEWRENVIRPLVNRFIDGFGARGEAELMEELARQIPLPLILHMMDLPTEGELAERYHEVAHAFGQLRWEILTGPTTDAVRERGTKTSQEMRDLLMPYVLERKSGEGDDLISRLWHAAPELYDGEVTDEGVYANVTTLFEAGIGTGAGALGDAMWALMKWPEYQEILRDDPSLVPNFVEEALRLTAPGLFIIRQVRDDVEFHGAPLKRGDTIVGVALTADRDPSHYPNPNQVDLARKAPRDHFAFASGPRACVGHAVGRAELQEVVLALTQRLRDLRPDPDKPAPRRAGAGARRPWDALHALFTPETARPA
jgi:cytochrome P450